MGLTSLSKALGYAADNGDDGPVERVVFHNRHLMHLGQFEQVVLDPQDRVEVREVAVRRREMLRQINEMATETPGETARLVQRWVTT